MKRTKLKRFLRENNIDFNRFLAECEFTGDGEVYFISHFSTYRDRLYKVLDKGIGKYVL